MQNPKITATYNDVHLAISLRHSTEQIRSVLTLAIECEEAAHNQAHKEWQTELKKVQAELTEIKEFNAQNPQNEKPLPLLPIEPVIDLNTRRACYFVELEEVDHELSDIDSPEAVVFDDVLFIKRTRPATKARTPEQIEATLRERFKVNRTDKVKNITVEVDGLIFDGDETSTERMNQRIQIMSDTDTFNWTLADNNVHEVTKQQLFKAFKLAVEEQSKLWN